MLLGRRRDTEALDGLNRDSDSRVQIPRTMMAAVAYATEFGGRSSHAMVDGQSPVMFGGQSPAYVAKWLYSLASNRNDSALKFITNSPYIEVPGRSVTRGISGNFTARLKSFAGIIISATSEGGSRTTNTTYTVTYDTDSSPPVQFMMAFFMMRLCYARAARHIAKYNKNEPESSEPNARFIDDQRTHAGEIENIFNAFYQGAVAAENDANNKNKKFLPVDPDIRRYFRENLALTPAKNENARRRLEFSRTLESSVTEGVITSTRRAMQIMIMDINAVLGSIKSKREHGSDGAESIEENPRAAASPVKQAASVPKKRASLVPKENKSEKEAGAETKSEGLDTQKKTSSKAHGKATKSSRVNLQKHSNDEQEEESHDPNTRVVIASEAKQNEDKSEKSRGLAKAANKAYIQKSAAKEKSDAKEKPVKIGLFGKDTESLETLLKNKGIITEGGYKKYTSLSEDDTASVIIVQLDVPTDETNVTIEACRKWQHENPKNRIVIFFDNTPVIDNDDDDHDDDYTALRNLETVWSNDHTNNQEKARDPDVLFYAVINGSSGDDYTYLLYCFAGADIAGSDVSKFINKNLSLDSGSLKLKWELGESDTEEPDADEKDTAENVVPTQETTTPVSIVEEKAVSLPSELEDPVKIAITRVVKKDTDSDNYKTVYNPYTEDENEVSLQKGSDDTATVNIELFGIREEKEVKYLVEKITKRRVYHSNQQYTEVSEGTLLALVGLKSNERTKDRIDKYVGWQNEKSSRLVVFVDLSDGNKLEKRALELTDDRRSLYYSDIDIEEKQIRVYCFGGEEIPSHDLMKTKIKWTKLDKPEPEPEPEPEPDPSPAPDQNAKDANVNVRLTIGDEDYSIPKGVLNKDETTSTKLNIKDLLESSDTYKVIVVPYNTVLEYARSLAPEKAGKKGGKGKKVKKGKNDAKADAEEEEAAEEEKEGKEEEEGKKGQGTADVIKVLIKALKERSSVIVFLCKEDSEWTKTRGFVHNPKGEAEWHSWLMRLSGGDNEDSSDEKSPKSPKSPFKMAVRCVKYEEEIGHGWFPISKRSLTATDKDPDVINLDGTYNIAIYGASKTTKDIREAGIRMALDYVSSTETDTNTKGICMPSTKKANIQNLMTKAQELVYLTLSSLDPVRIYALAPGAGKTRCMALALFCSMVDIGTGSDYCVVMHTENMIVAYDQIVNEIMKSIYDGESPAVLHTSGYSDIGTALMVKKHGSTEAVQKIKGDRRTQALDLTIRALKDNNITILTPKELTDEIGKGELRYTCIIADECHHVIGALSNSANSSKVKNVERFIGFSATPFKNKEDLESLLGWARRMSAASALADLKSSRVHSVVSGLGASKPEQELDAWKAKTQSIIGMLRKVVEAAVPDDTEDKDKQTEASGTFVSLRKKADEYLNTMTTANTTLPKGQKSADEAVTQKSIDAAALELRLASMKLENVSTVERFVASSVVYADERDVTRMLPYALITYEAIVATGPVVSVSNKNLFSVSIKQGSDTETYYDYNDEFDAEDYGAAIDKVLELLLDQTNKDSRSLVYIRSGSKINTLIAKVKNTYKSYHVAESKGEIGILNKEARKNIILIDRKPAKQSTHSKPENDQADYVRRIFNLIDTGNDGEQRFREYRAIITDNAESVEYFEVRNTYIIDIPTDRNECMQARNRAFRLCSQYKLKQSTNTKPTHTVKYVLVERKVDGKQDYVIRRGAYALATAHYKDESESLLASAQRLDLSGGAKPIGLSVTNAPKPVATYLIDKVRPEHAAILAEPDRFAQYADKSREIKHPGAVTVLDVSSYLKTNQQKYVETYDKRIQGLFPKTGESAVEFDLRGALYCAHHTLRGITFSNAAQMPKTKGDGTLILRYGSSGGESGDREGVKDIASETGPVILENALESATVYTGVSTVYYEDAHKVQCIGHARFECFRTIGAIVEKVEEAEEVEHKKAVKPPARVFVGSEDRFHSFIGMLSSGYGYRGNCHDEGRETKYTPMVIAMELRRALLMGLHCSVSIGANIAYKENLTEYLEAELKVEEWTTLIEVNQGNKEKENLVSVSVSQKEKGAVQQDQTVLRTKDFTVSESANADSISSIAKEKEEKLNSDVLYVVPADKYDDKEYEGRTNADFAPTIELRIGKKKKFQTRVGHINNIRCTTAIFVGHSYTDWDLARINADVYYSLKT